MPRKPNQTSLFGALFPEPARLQPPLLCSGRNEPPEKCYCPFQAGLIRGMSAKLLFGIRPK